MNGRFIVKQNIVSRNFALFNFTSKKGGGMLNR
jgi:hypothetical protein